MRQLIFPNRLKHICLALLLGVQGLTACETLVDNMNTDPNSPTDASASLILTGAQLNNMAVQEGHIARVAGMWSGYFTGVDRQYKDINSYNVTGASFNDAWQFVFQGVVQQSNLVIEKSAATNNRLVQGIAKVIKAHALGTATASWGDIPFSELADIVRFPNPAFEPQEQVYDKLQLLLDEAIVDLASGLGTSPGAADIHFGGNAAKWLEAAHTLKARFYLETRQYELAATAAEKGIKAGANSMMAPHGSSLNVNENLMYTFIGRSRVGDLNASQAMLPQLLNPASTRYRGNAKTAERARFNYYFLTQSGTTTIPTIPNTSTPTATNGVTLKGIFSQAASYPLVTFSENLLTAAEALARTQGLSAGLNQLNAFRQYMDAGGYIDPTYLTGGEAAYNYEPYVAADFAPGGMLNPDGIASDQALLREILLERYITFFGQVLGFNDVRRTRKEAVGVKLLPNAGAQLPERLIYSESEVNSNRNAPNPVPGVFIATAVNAR